MRRRALTFANAVSASCGAAKRALGREQHAERIARSVAASQARLAAGAVEKGKMGRLEGAKPLSEWIAERKLPPAKVDLSAKAMTAAGAKLGPGYGQRIPKETMRISDKTVGVLRPGVSKLASVRGDDGKMGHWVNVNGHPVFIEEK